jgi:hypothetical protein
MLSTPSERSDAGYLHGDSTGQHQSRKTKGGAENNIIFYPLKNKKGRELGQTLTKSPVETVALGQAGISPLVTGYEGENRD